MLGFELESAHTRVFYAEIGDPNSDAPTAREKKGGSASMASVNADFLARWHSVVDDRDLAGLEKLLDTDVTMGAPPYWDKLRGRPLVHHLLGLIIHTIEDFTYHREWHDDSRGNGEIALEFHGHIGELDLQGIDLISLNERGEIRNLDVVIRPMNALAALRDVIAPQMAEYLRAIAKNVAQ